MPLINIRELVEFPVDPNNPNSTIINGVNFNLTALNYYNYTLYSNGTLSNGTKCVLAFDAYQPTLLWNGTFINGTTCYAPIESIEDRGKIGIAFSSFFALQLFFAVVNLRKHGKRYLPIHKRFSLVGRRWQWYWLIFLASVATISCVMSVDVDRYFLQDLPLILQSIFYHLMLPIMLAAIWEGVRHWGSWLERQIYDADPFAFEAQTSRERHELYMPLLFYFFGFMHFFLTVPRSWTRVPMQSSPEQSAAKAIPTGTDARFKAASIVAIPCIIIICYCIYHNFYWYKRCPPGRSPIIFYATSIPLKFTLAIILVTIKVAFNIAAAFVWRISPLKYDVNNGWLYGLGYTPVLVALIIFNIWGYLDQNEDRIIIQQRIARGQAADAELGIDRTRKPAWWKLMRLDFQHISGNDPNSRLLSMVNNVAGAGKSSTTNENQNQGQTQSHNHNLRRDSDFEMAPLYRDNSHSSNGSVPPYTQQPVDTRPPPPAYSSYDSSTGPAPQATRSMSNTGSLLSTSSTQTNTSGAPVQKVRSMLDV
ncbi:hypothetical protein VTO42DRAFT_6969 [Malbranchea cinnamomea]